VESNGITSPFNFYRLRYYYYASKFLNRVRKKETLLEKYIEQGRRESTACHSRQFSGYFTELSFFIEQDENEKLISEIRNHIEQLRTNNSDEISRKVFEENFNRLAVYFSESKKQVAFFREKNRHYSNIIDIVKSISGMTEMGKMMDVVVKKLIDILNADLVAIVSLYENVRMEYLIRDMAFRKYEMSEVKFKGDVVLKMLKTSKIEFSSNVSGHSAVDASITADVGEKFFSIAAVPIIVQGEIKAFIYFERSVSKGVFIESEINFIEILVENVGVAFDNVKLLEIATVDMLTRVNTRRHFMSILEKEIEKAERYQFPLSMILLDIDHFKQINDVHGHLMGDNVLSKLGQLMKNNVRNTDYVGRLGGEEFAILLPGTTGQGAMKTAEKIRKKCEELDFSGLSVKLSLGIVSFLEDSVENEKDFINKADIALYSAKNTGRNRSVVYSDL